MFDPENVIYYNAPWSPQRAPDRERHQQWVQAQDYDQLLSIYKALKSQASLRTSQVKPEYAGKVGFRPPNFKGNWR